MANFGYTLEMTLLLSFLAIAFSWLVFNFIERLKIKVDKKFVLAILPWVLFTSAVRVAQDFHLFHFLELKILSSPYIYGIMAVFTSLLIFILYKKNRKNYWKISFFLGLFAFSVVFSFLPTYRNLLIFIYLLAFFLPWFFLFFLLYKKKILSKENFLTLTSNSFASNTAFVKIQFFGYMSIHFFPSLIIKFFSPFSFVLVNFLVVLTILACLDKFVKEKNLRNYIKFLISIFALLTATRALF
jgi:uncharacterized membrane protein